VGIARTVWSFTNAVQRDEMAIACGKLLICGFRCN
jgi:hypothetical protein